MNWTRSTPVTDYGTLHQVILPDGDIIEYLIDGRNRRVGKKIGGELQKTRIYHDQLSPVAQFDGEGNLTHRFVYAEMAHAPSWMVIIDPVTDEETVYRIITDHLGSIRLVIEAETGVIAQRIDYGPFGEVLLDSNPGFQPFGFAGGIHDRDTGLVRFGARDYDPGIGRWTAKDPIDFYGGDANLYGYVIGDSVNFLDQDGKSRLRSYSNPHRHPAYQQTKPYRNDLHEALENLPDHGAEKAMELIEESFRNDLERGYMLDSSGYPIIPDPNYKECWWKCPTPNTPISCSVSERGPSYRSDGCWKECTTGPVMKAWP